MADSPTFNWWMKECNAALFKPVLSALIAEFKTTFKTLQSDTAKLGPHVLLEDSKTGFRLEEDTSMQDNQFHPYTCGGAGEIPCEHGHIPVLFFASLKKKINVVPDLAEKLLFCDEQGEYVQLNDWLGLKNELRRMGFNPDQVRSDAEAIGFVDAIIHLDKIVTNEPSMFF